MVISMHCVHMSEHMGSPQRVRAPASHQTAADRLPCSPYWYSAPYFAPPLPPLSRPPYLLEHSGH